MIVRSARTGIPSILCPSTATQLPLCQRSLVPICRRQELSRFVLRAGQSRVSYTTSHKDGSSGKRSTHSDDPSRPSMVFQRQRKMGLSRWQGFRLGDQHLHPVHDATLPNLEKDSEENMSLKQILLSPQTALAVFLPKGYPHSVTSNYWPFAKWQFFHNVAGSVTAVISTQALLFAMGLGAGSIPMAAALNWIIKDGLGQLGGVVYASFVSDKFDSEPKRFRFQATVAMQGANVLELLSPLWPGSFLFIASVSNIGKNMAWLASSATRAQMNKTFALRDNLGDITGKTGSQTTAAGLVGTGLGVIIAAIMSRASPDPAVLPLIPMCLTFLPFSIFNIYSNYRSSQFVTTPSFNIPRTETVFYTLLQKLVATNALHAPPAFLYSVDSIEKYILSPEDIAEDEVFVRKYKSPFRVHVDIEPDLATFASEHGTAVLDRALTQKDLEQPLVGRRERYYIATAGVSTKKPTVAIWFDRRAKTSDILRGFYHACTTRLLLESEVDASPAERETVVHRAYEHVRRATPSLMEALVNRGWDTDSHFLTDGDRNHIFVQH
ncbi:hypothetical protein BGW42_006600 [Actinomortierella wolfii]|nr:hypothetical protein BGW42_006600 [Actinomortierella wolfii]